VLLPWFRRPLLIGAGALGAAALASAGLDRLAEGVFGRVRPGLERSLSAQLDQQVRLGRYLGLRAWGVQLGPLSVAPRGMNRSSLRVERLNLTLAPLASLRQGVPTLLLDLGPTTVTLEANNRGQYWRAPARSRGQQPPQLDLRARLLQPAQLSIPAQRVRYQLTSALALRPDQHRLELRSSLRPQQRGHRTGLVQLHARGNWKTQRWQMQLALRQMAITDLTSLLPSGRAVRVPGTLDGGLQLRWADNQPHCGGALRVQQLLWRGATAQQVRGLERAELHCSGQTLTLRPTTLRWNTWQALASASLRWRGHNGLQLERLALRRGRSWISARGSVTPGLDLRSRLQLHPQDLNGPLPVPAWLGPAPLQANLSAQGGWSKPELKLTVSRRQDPLLGAWAGEATWSAGVVRLSQLRSRSLQASGSLPLALRPGQGLRSGLLQLQLALRAFPLQRLQPLVGAQLGGVLQAQGTVSGALQALVPDLQLQLTDLAAGPLLLRERWSGHWYGQAGGGGRLEMTAQGPAPQGQLSASLNRRWMPTAVALQRGTGSLTLQGLPRAYRWQARALLLDGLAWRAGSRGAPHGVRGLLSGSGQLGLQPLAFSGAVALQRPAVLGLRLQQAQLSGRYQDGRYQLQALLKPPGSGQMTLVGRGRWQGAIDLALQARGIEQSTLQQLADVWPQWQGPGSSRIGSARDLGTLLIDSLGQSVQQQLLLLEQARAELASSGRNSGLPQGNLEQRLRQLQARVDADISLRGPRLNRAWLDLAAKGHLWLASATSDTQLSQEPFVARIQGPLRQGGGSFSLEQLPLSLLALLTPVPSSLRGNLNVAGRYGLGRAQSELSLQLGLRDAELAGTAITMPRGQVDLQGEALKLDLALLAAGSSSSIDLAGLLPLDPDRADLELRIASRSDGLRFLATLAQPSLQWLQGSADLQLLLRGSVNDPIANGFVRIRDGRIQFIGQAIEDLEATVVFDFEQMLVQSLSARVGRGGRLSASGHLGLLNPTPTQPPLSVDLEQVGFTLPRIQGVANGRLQIDGSLRDLQMGGELAIDRGTINTQRGRLMPSGGGDLASAPRKGVAQLLEENWDFQKPLLLVGAEVESNSSQAVLDAVPRFKPLGFNDLRLKLGPNLRIGIPGAASFQTAGLLRLTGRLDPSLRARGVVRLLQGRLNLFTTTFSLDPEAPNVAVFTPALGLIPYLDIAMRTRVSDSLSVTGQASSGTPSLAEIESQGGLNSLNQLNLVRITVSVSGPADRLVQNLKLRSSPPLPDSRLIALIGGNSLAGLSGSGAGAAIATVVGQTLLSPVLGGLSDAFGQRLSFALYPTYVNPNVTSQEALQSQRLAPQLVLGSEIGIDVTERFNVSVLAAPNRSDVPPQINLNVRANDLLTVQGTVDTQGAWQTQLQLFFRF